MKILFWLFTALLLAQGSWADEEMTHEAWLIRDPEFQIPSLNWDAGDIQILRTSVGDRTQTVARLEGQFLRKYWHLEFEGHSVPLDSKGHFIFYLPLTHKITEFEVKAVNDAVDEIDIERAQVVWRNWRRAIVFSNPWDFNVGLSFGTLSYGGNALTAWSNLSQFLTMNLHHSYSADWEGAAEGLVSLVNWDESKPNGGRMIEAGLLAQRRLNRIPQSRDGQTVTSFAVGAGPWVTTLLASDSLYSMPLMIGINIRSSFQIRWGDSFHGDLWFDYGPYLLSGGGSVDLLSTIHSTLGIQISKELTNGHRLGLLILSSGNSQRNSQGTLGEQHTTLGINYSL